MNLPPVNCVSVPSLSSSTQEIYGTIRVRCDIYEILSILFSSTGFLGRGTLCYLAVHNGVVYVIKDHWVSGSPLHEVRMLKCVQGIKGVPTYVDSWEVKVKEDVVETMERYREERFRRKMKSIRTHVRLVTTPRVHPLTHFTSKKEFVIAIRGILRSMYSFILTCNRLTDIFTVQKEAVERHVLHHDCSMNNCMIEDRPKGPLGSLIDWEHAVQIIGNNEYDMGGTVS
ncbi:hypothetical protein SCLCIDRAFT_119450 [Scleroderma citrinum Foug A]|uniref:Fungal-type protein kinase domain-containing protein n=1 Tax=Scleroderma citrinum Foug A TaxID=1036808 RepID=A0A0C3AC11_9AGAM|nr:hypothetical protein SCLCIDRAFT_119450 [Scleroderma citrinum Foug A]